MLAYAPELSERCCLTGKLVRSPHRSVLHFEVRSTSCYAGNGQLLIPLTTDGRLVGAGDGLRCGIL